nr:hypothetical protein BaRGS_009399 [Batillaria attramentaria]
MSPEMVQGKPYNSKTDIWSFGITAVYVATLQDAVKARTFDTLFRKTREGEVSGIAGAYSENVQNIVNRMLHPLPDNRPSAGKLVTDMRLVFRNCTKPPAADSYPGRSSQRQSREEPRTRDVAISNPWSSLSRMQEGVEDVRVSPAEAVNEELTVESLSVNVVVNVIVSTTEVQLQQPRSGSSSYSVHIDVHVRPRRGGEHISSSHGQTSAARAPQPGQPATRIQQQQRFDEASSADNRLDPTAPEDECPVQGDKPPSKPDLFLNTFPGAFGVNRRPYSGYLPPLENPPAPRMGDSAKEKKKKSNRRTSGPASSAAGDGVGASGATSSATEGRGEVSQRRHGRSKSETQARDVPQELSSPAAVPVDIPPEQWESSMREYWEIATDLMYKMDPAKFWLVVKFTKLFSRQEVEMWLEENVGKGMGECVDMFERLLDLDNQLTREENVYLVESLHRTGQIRGGNHDEQRDGGQGGDNPALSRTGSSSGLGDSWDSTDF